MKRISCLLILLLLLCGCKEIPVETSSFVTDTTAAFINTDTESEPVQTDSGYPQTVEAMPQAEKPLILTSFYIYDDEIAIGGTVQSGASVTAKAGGYTQTQKAQGQTFFISIPCGAEYSITATAPGFSESDSVSFTAKKDKNAKLSECYVGSDSQLFLKAHIADYTGDNLFTANQLGYLKHLVEENIDTLRDKTGKKSQLIYMIIPDPQILYPELAPASLGAMCKESQITQFVKAAEGIEGVTVIDLTPILAAHKADGILIKQTDSHWTEAAGFYAYEALHLELLKAYPNIKTYTIDDFEQVTLQSVVGNYITDKSLFYEEETYLHPKFAYKNPLYTHMSADTIQNLHIRGEYEVSTQDGSLPVCQFVRDSFSTCMMKYLAEDFSYTYMQEMWVHKINFEKAGQVKPDFVIHLLLQNNLGELLKQ